MPSLPSFADIINELADSIHDIALDHGFWESNRTIGESISLIHSELSEWLEAARHRTCSLNRMDEHCPEFSNEEIEAADAIIRILDLAAKEQYKIGEALMAKIEFNKSRPYKHGEKQ
jgi:NTP pyrophosphatase (non-canonical NTP hydrolase)